MARQYMDEAIRAIINEVEEQEAINSQNIYEGVTINGRRYEFGETAFFNGRMKLYLPNDFTDMPEKTAKIKYPSSDRPQIIKSNEQGSVNITLNLIPNAVNDDQVEEIKDGIKFILKRLNPSYLFFEEGLEIIGEKSIGFFEFKSPALDVPLFNLMFFTVIETDIMHGVFNCSFEEYEPWRPVARQIMSSVRIMPEPA